MINLKIVLRPSILFVQMQLKHYWNLKIEHINCFEWRYVKYRWCSVFNHCTKNTNLMNRFYYLAICIFCRKITPTLLRTVFYVHSPNVLNFPVTAYCPVNPSLFTYFQTACHPIFLPLKLLSVFIRLETMWIDDFQPVVRWTFLVWNCIQLFILHFIIATYLYTLTLSRVFTIFVQSVCRYGWVLVIACTFLVLRIFYHGSRL